MIIRANEYQAKYNNDVMQILALKSYFVEIVRINN
jgi:hypothetical protein